MSGYGAGCEDCVRCEADDCDQIAFCLSEPGTSPCPHDRTLCGEHNLDACPDCRREAELDMYHTGVYSPAADPFYNHTAPTREPVVNPYFDAATNSYRFPRSPA